MRKWRGPNMGLWSTVYVTGIRRNSALMHSWACAILIVMMIGTAGSSIHSYFDVSCTFILPLTLSSLFSIWTCHFSNFLFFFSSGLSSLFSISLPPSLSQLCLSVSVSVSLFALSASSSLSLCLSTNKSLVSPSSPLFLSHTFCPSLLLSTSFLLWWCFTVQHSIIICYFYCDQ